MLAFGVCLVAYATDWLWHDLQVYRLHAVAHDIREGKPFTNAELAGALPSAIDLDRMHGLRASDLDDAGQVASLFADRNRANRLLAPALQATAEHLLRERLALAPADGNSWLRLAFVRTARFGLDPKAKQALRMSWLVTPREFAVMWPALKFRMNHWQELTAEEQDTAADLAVGLWHKPPERDALRRYLADFPPGQRRALLARIVDPAAGAALSAP
ncbi:MAG: hypothetical protein ABSD21_02390 [Rhizomicrobium sp.]